MTIKLYSTRWGELPVTQQFPNAPHGLILPDADLQVAAGPNNRYYYLFQKFNMEKVTIIWCHFFSCEKDTLTVITEQPISVRLATRGSHRYTTRSFNMQIAHERNYNCFYLSHQSMEYQIEAGANFSFVDIFVHTDHLHSLATPLGPLQEFLAKVNRKCAAKLAPRNQVASIELLRWIDELVEWMATADKSVETGEKIVLQLVKKSVYGLTNNLCKTRIIKNQEEVNKIYKAADIIQSAGDYYTKNNLHELALLVGLSLYKLRTLFNNIYGYSILKHQSEQKMRLALRLVETKRLSEKVVCDILGFSSAQSFSRKYKLRFGHSPYRLTQKERIFFSK
jgi:AraC-like DNA-binding protein